MHSVGHQSDPDDGELITSHTIPNKKTTQYWDYSATGCAYLQFPLKVLMSLFVGKVCLKSVMHLYSWSAQSKLKVKQ